MHWRAAYYRTLRSYMRGDVTMGEVDQAYDVWQEQLTLRGLL